VGESAAAADGTRKSENGFEGAAGEEMQETRKNAARQRVPILIPRFIAFMEWAF
jgi:hypothetical protein